MINYQDIIMNISTQYEEPKNDNSSMTAERNSARVGDAAPESDNVMITNTIGLRLNRDRAYK